MDKFRECERLNTYYGLLIRSLVGCVYMRKQYLQMSILIFIAIIISIVVLQELFIRPNEKQTTQVSFYYQLLEHTAYCGYFNGEYFFTVPDCRSYQLGRSYQVVGRLQVVSDSNQYKQKRLVVESIRKVEFPKHSYQYWQGLAMKLQADIRTSLFRPIEALLEVEYAGLARAVTLGDTSEVTSDQQQLFKTTGTWHIVAVSGYNFAILVAAGEQALNKVRSRTTKGACILLLIMFYAFLVGAQASVVRAALMVTGSVWARYFLQRQYSATVWLVTAATLMLLLRPSWVTEPGFQLSFLATAALVFGGKSDSPLVQLLLGGGRAEHTAGQQTLVSRVRTFLREALDSFLVSIRVFLWTTPLIVLHFNQVSLVGIFATTSVFWLLPFLTKEGTLSLVLASLLFQVPSLHQVAVIVVTVGLEFPLQVFQRVLQFFERASWLTVSELEHPWLVAGLWYCLLIAVIYSKRKFIKTVPTQTLQV